MPEAFTLRALAEIDYRRNNLSPISAVLSHSRTRLQTTRYNAALLARFDLLLAATVADVEDQLARAVSRAREIGV